MEEKDTPVQPPIEPLDTQVESINDLSIINNPPTRQHYSRLFMIILLFFTGLLIFTGYILVKYKQRASTAIQTSLVNSKVHNQTDSVPQETPNQSKTFTQNFWGFETKIQSNWYGWQGIDGNDFYFASYDGKNDAVWHNTDKNQIKIQVTVLSKDVEEDYTGSSPENIISQKAGPTIGNKPSKEINAKYQLSPYDINRQSSQPTISVNPEDWTITNYIVRNNGYTYVIRSEPSDSLLNSSLSTFLSQFTFIPKTVFIPRSTPASEGKQYYEDTNLGYSFEYPSSDTFKTDEDSLTGAIDKYWFRVYIPYHRWDETGDFSKDIQNYASISCAASGPMGSRDCPIEDISVEPFVNSHQVAGYKVHRQVVFDRATQSGEWISSKDPDEIIAYPLKSPQYFAIIFVSDSILDANQKYLKDIADSFIYLEEKQSE